jgi:hypothetical protein
MQNLNEAWVFILNIILRIMSETVNEGKINKKGFFRIPLLQKNNNSLANEYQDV